MKIHRKNSCVDISKPGTHLDSAPNKQCILFKKYRYHSSLFPFLSKFKLIFQELSIKNLETKVPKRLRQSY